MNDNEKKLLVKKAKTRMIPLKSDDLYKLIEWILSDYSRVTSNRIAPTFSLIGLLKDFDQEILSAWYHGWNGDLEELSEEEIKGPLPDWAIASYLAFQIKLLVDKQHGR